MKATFRLFVTVLLVLGWGLAAGALHVVWTGQSPVILPKAQLGIDDTYVDVSQWKPQDVSNHPVISKRLVAAGKAEVLAHVFNARSKDDLISQIYHAIARGPTTPPTKPDGVVAQARTLASRAKAAFN